MRSEFRDLAAYQRCTVLANDLHRELGRWPNFDRWSLGIQLMRAVDSIGANVAEAAGRLHDLDRRRFLLNARGSLYETEHWLLAAEERRLLDAGVLQRLDGIARPLAGLIDRHTPS